MRIIYNENRDVVDAIRAGLKKRMAIAHAVWRKSRTMSACARSSEIKLQILSSKGTATACFITKKNN